MEENKRKVYYDKQDEIIEKKAAMEGYIKNIQEKRKNDIQQKETKIFEVAL